MNSIEWLAKEFKAYNYSQDDGMIIVKIPKHIFENKIEQAKEMHKQEIIDAYEKGEFDCGCNGTGEDYYNKTFKKD